MLRGREKGLDFYLICRYKVKLYSAVLLHCKTIKPALCGFFHFREPMRVLVKRESFFPRCTMGSLYIDGKFVCYTLEDKVREKPGVLVEAWKIPRETAIPVGVYPCFITMSNRFRKLLPELMGVAGFSGVRIHGGNDESNTEGCILVGTYKKVTTIHNCAPAMTLVQGAIQKALSDHQQVTVEIRGLPE